MSLNEIDKIDFFRSFTTSEKLKLIDELQFVSFEDGEYIFHQGHDGENFYIIKEGAI